MVPCVQARSDRIAGVSKPGRVREGSYHLHFWSSLYTEFTNTLQIRDELNDPQLKGVKTCKRWRQGEWRFVASTSTGRMHQVHAAAQISCPLELCVQLC